MFDTGQESAAQTAPPDTSADVVRERCDFLYRRALPGVATSLVLSLLLSAYLWRLRPTELVLMWQVLMLICGGAYAALALAYRRSKRAKDEPELWIRLAAYGA